MTDTRSAPDAPAAPTYRDIILALRRALLTYRECEDTLVPDGVLLEADAALALSAPVLTHAPEMWAETLDAVEQALHTHDVRDLHRAGNLLRAARETISP